MFLKKITYFFMFALISLSIHAKEIMPEKKVVACINEAEHRLPMPDSDEQAMIDGMVRGVSIGFIPTVGLGLLMTNDNTSWQMTAGIISGILVLFGGIGSIKMKSDNNAYREAYAAAKGLDLHAAAAYGNINGVKALLQYGFSPNKVDQNKMTPADYANASCLPETKPILIALSSGANRYKGYRALDE